MLARGRGCGARGAGRLGKTAGLRERAAVLLRFHDLLLDNAREALDIVQLETGKARRSAFEEVLDVAIQARYYAHTAAGFLRPRRRQGALPLLTARHGVPPSARRHRHDLAVELPAVALDRRRHTGAAGRQRRGARAQRPDAVHRAVGRPRCSTRRACRSASLQVVTGRGAELGTPLIDATDYLMFTGSTATGSW